MKVQSKAYHMIDLDFHYHMKNKQLIPKIEMYTDQKLCI